MMLIVRVQQVEIEKGFGAVGAGNSQDVVVDTQRGELAKVIGMRGSQCAREGARANQADDDKGGEDKAEREASQADGNGDGGSEYDENEMIEMQRPANENAGSKTNESDEEAGEASPDHAVDAGEVFGREVAHGQDALRLEDEDAPAITLAAGDIKTEKGDAGDERDKGAIAQNSKQGVLPFQIRCERMSIRRPEKDGGYGQQG